MILALRLVQNLLRLPFLPLYWLSRLVARPRAGWLRLKLRSRVLDIDPPQSPLEALLDRFSPPRHTSIEKLRRLAAHIGTDEQLEGILIELPPLRAGWATLASLREVIEGIRERGKKVVVYLPDGGSHRELYVAAAAERLLLGPEATLMFLGLSLEQRYYKGLLDKLGIGVQPIAQGDYKSAGENLARESMSEPQREQLTALLHTIDGELRAALEARPDLDEAKVRELHQRAFIRTKDAVEIGLADGAAYEDELPRAVARFADGDDNTVRFIGAGKYFAFREGRFFRRVLKKPYVAVVSMHGPIVPSAFGAMSAVVDPKSVAARIRSARRDRYAVGVVLHIDSGGGSALASDQIYREVVRLKEKKPVVAYLANIAASGGYYIAAPADAIIAQPLTITGSIGVVATRFGARQLLEALGVNTEVIRSAPHADMFSPARELSDEELAILDRETAGFYETFLRIVADGRSRSVDEIRAVAGGRVWSGRDAVEQGLVDRLGSFGSAVDELLERAEVPTAIRRRIECRPPRVGRGEVPPPEPMEEAAAAAALG
ncbi:MAG: signal peptide peptidase SppA, partial [Myxococcota bacterium]